MLYPTMASYRGNRCDAICMFCREAKCHSGAVRESRDIDPCRIDDRLKIAEHRQQESDIIVPAAAGAVVPLLGICQKLGRFLRSLCHPFRIDDSESLTLGEPGPARLPSGEICTATRAMKHHHQRQRARSTRNVQKIRTDESFKVERDTRVALSCLVSRILRQLRYGFTTRGWMATGSFFSSPFFGSSFLGSSAPPRGPRPKPPFGRSRGNRSGRFAHRIAVTDIT